VLPRLPPEIPERLAGVDMILHAGDIVLAGTLTRLAEVAPVVAVQGNHDRLGALDLPQAAIVRAGRFWIGVAHGNRPRPIELAAAVVSLARGRVRTLGLPRHLARRLGHPDLAVFGHLHVPMCVARRGTVVFSPGSAYVGTDDPATSVAARVSSRLRRRRLPEPVDEAAIGIVEIDGPVLRARRVPLAGPVRPTRPERRGRRPGARPAPGYSSAP